MRLLTRAGGVNTCIVRDELHISPIFIIHGMQEIEVFIKWVQNNLEKIKEVAEKTTKHGKLINVESKITGEGVILKFSYSTGNAMGMNMINKATDEACKFISQFTKAKYYIRSNFSSDKKISAHNFIKGYGKEVFAEATISKRLFIERKIRTTPEDIYNYRTVVMSSSIYAGMFGMNAQFANFLAAIFIACGQDVAQVVNSSIGVSSCKILPSGDLYISVYLPNLLVGTVGGGTALPTQRECLEILGCYGQGAVLKFTEIVAAGVLAGELAISIAITNGSFVEAHEKLGRNRPQ
jgi:hydroxymethylglutaryl-CoA reductase (NADPH)